MEKTINIPIYKLKTIENAFRMVKNQYGVIKRKEKHEDTTIDREILLADRYVKETLEQQPKSELLKQEAAEEDNDLKAMGLEKKAHREKRIEKFDEKWKDILLNSNQIISYNDDGTKLSLETIEYGVIDFFPKSNRLLIRKINKWKDKGLNWLIRQLNLKEGE